MSEKASKQPTLPETAEPAEEQAAADKARPAKRVQDPEVQAMATITDAIAKATFDLDDKARDRVIRWIGERFFGQEPPL